MVREGTVLMHSVGSASLCCCVLTSCMSSKRFPSMNSNTKKSSSFSRITSLSLTMLGWLSFFKDFTSRSCMHSSQLHSGKRVNENRKTVLSGEAMANTRGGNLDLQRRQQSGYITYPCDVLAHAGRSTMCNGGKMPWFNKEGKIPAPGQR